MVQDLGENCYLFKLDLKNAFRLLPVNPADFSQLGFKFDDKFYVDKCMPMAVQFLVQHLKNLLGF